MIELRDIVQKYNETTQAIADGRGKTAEFAELYNSYSNMVAELMFSGYRFDTQSKSILKYPVVSDLVDKLREAKVVGDTLEEQLLAYYHTLDSSEVDELIEALYPNRDPQVVLDRCYYTINIVKKQLGIDDDKAVLCRNFLSLNAVLDLGLF